MTVRAPFHARVLEGAGGPAEEGVRGHSERAHRLGDLLLPDPGQAGAIALEVPEFGGDDLPALSSSRGEHHDLCASGHKGRDRASRRDGLIVGMSVHEEHAWRDSHGILVAQSTVLVQAFWRRSLAWSFARSFCSSSTLRMRIVAGVTSTYSSSRANSRLSSRVSLRGGVRFSKLSADA